MLENQEGADAEDYIHSLKIDMFSDEVFVFTPGGDVQNLPAGATPIDFAYAIHSAVGNRMVGAKVNGRIVTLDHVLKNGDIVEILTSKNAKGPSRDWMKIARSSEARSKIRQWFKKEKKEENIANGRAAFEAELKHCGISMKDVLSPEMLPVLLKRVSYGSLDDMYAAIGYGGFTAQKAVSRIQGELNRVAKLHQAEKAAEDGEKIIMQIDREGETVGLMSVQVCPIAKDDKTFKKVCRRAESVISVMKCKMRVIPNLQQECFRHLSPSFPNSGKMESILQKIVPMSTFVGGFPFASSGFNDGAGYYFAQDSSGGLVIVDVWKRGGDRTNSKFCRHGQFRCWQVHGNQAYHHVRVHERHENPCRRPGIRVQRPLLQPRRRMDQCRRRRWRSV